MADRDLAHGEKRFAVFTSEKGRDRADARRQIEGLNQGEAMVQMLISLNEQAARQTELLEYMAARLHGIEAKTQTGASSSP